MTSLDVYAAFLTARWDEIEERGFHTAECGVRNHYEPFCDCDAEDMLQADLAAKRAVLLAGTAAAGIARGYAAAGIADERDSGRREAYSQTLRDLAAPFRDHPDHPANQEA